ncbi:DUF547 domain-containing protein [Leptothoe sp. PORK10 BA2]|uniref:DUF547 domain-containing protein n=1 Tax=Leptothoe sp. PORK10 BA2 TaxID=3110254 RepID=UPI002B210C02|nr:DUF547 domain-containing protein [Leptothoe sp. PORK10 BA2]MEA5462828.1 DUF547 domain-containing protein [Leptothoe sp. PORK10 BA2]
MKRHYFSAFFLACSIGLVGCSTGTVTPQPAPPASEAALSEPPDKVVNYAIYDDVLKTYVDASGLVDYSGLQASRQMLDTFNNGLATVDDATSKSWSETDQIAYWVNAYNSLTLKSIVDQTPLKASIKDIVGVWRLNKHRINGQEKTLDNIEHDILRANFNEPRIHSALVCAAISCPPLRSEVFTGKDLDAQLDDQVTQWLARPDGLRIDQEAGEVQISMIFSWFGDDWIPTYGVEDGFTGSNAEKAVLNFISNYVSEDDRAYLAAGNYSLSYFDYDWSLNKQ